MATDYMRSMLNELMGSARNEQDDENASNSLRYEDRDVCRPFLLKCCPHEILTSTVNTKSIKNKKGLLNISYLTQVVFFRRDRFDFLPLCHYEKS